MAKAKVTITFERNDSHPKGEDSLTMGPFEWIQFTYDSVRAGENGEIELAGRTAQGLWETDGKQIGTSETWSDMIISAEASGL
jgi:hypothetical protein